MNANQIPATSPMPLTAIDWQKLARDAFGAGWVAGFIGGTLQTVAKIIEEKNAAPSVSRIPDQILESNDDEEDEATVAAAMLGVSVDASADEIRSALRSRLAASGLHPDQGGDGVEATKLIAAKNLLIDRLRGAA